MKANDVLQSIVKQLNTLDNALKGYTVVLFGSRATQNARPRSDFDIGIIGDAPLPAQLFYHIEEQFDQIDTLYTIDWVDLTQTTADFRREALKNVKVLYEG